MVNPLQGITDAITRLDRATRNFVPGKYMIIHFSADTTDDSMDIVVGENIHPMDGVACSISPEEIERWASDRGVDLTFDNSKQLTFLRIMTENANAAP